MIIYYLSVYYYPHFAGEETEAQRVKVIFICPSQATSKWQSRIRSLCIWVPTAHSPKPKSRCCSRRCGKGRKRRERASSSGPAQFHSPVIEAQCQGHWQVERATWHHEACQPLQQSSLGEGQQALGASPAGTRAPTRSLKMTLGEPLLLTTGCVMLCTTSCRSQWNPGRA